MSNHAETMDALAAFYKAQAEALIGTTEANPIPYTPKATTWPKPSYAAKVHPRQIRAAMEAARRRGVPCEFNARGEPIFTSRKHRKDYCEQVRGFHDMDGGCGDPKSNGPIGD